MDTLTSCYFAVSFICYCRDVFPDMECHLDQSGTDCCETYFSTMGQWVGNKHNYSFGDMRRNQAHCIRLEEIRSSNNGINFPKPHPKGESIWHKQYESGCQKVNLREYPQDGEEFLAWKEGMQEARKLALSVGMKPEYHELDSFPPYENIPNTDIWFYDPLSGFSKTVVEEEDDHDESDDDDLDMQSCDINDVDFNVEGNYNTFIAYTQFILKSCFNRFLEIFFESRFF